MLKVGITGGIGSGKSLVARMFEVLGIPILHADDTAKYLMQHDADLMASISRVFGTEVYQNGRLNRPFLASVVFADKEKLAQLNSLVHPAVLRYGQQWAESQSSPYTLKEAAIFFESGSYKDMDKMVGVYAPYEMRLQRAMQRDHASEDSIKQRMAQQMDEEEKMKRCDYIIQNDGSVSVISQVLELHQVFCAMAAGRS